MSAKVLRIFVSSPGDVGEERVMTERVVERLSGEFGRSFTLEPFLWEHEPVRATASFQEQIVPPSQCDIVVSVLWSRLGTRLPVNVGAEGKTGTEWEFEDAARSYEERKVPDLLVYRKTRTPFADLRDEPSFEEKRKQLKALDGFVKRWFESKDGTFRAAFKTFESLDQFETLLENDLRKLIRDRITTSEGETPTWHHEPFRGLEAFDFEHAPIFFGRTRAIGALKEALVSQERRNCPFVLVFGMSGVGKSSLVRAGLLPTITRPGVIEGIGLWRWCVFRPSDAVGDLCDGLAAALCGPKALPELSDAGVSPHDLAALLREAPDQAALPVRVGLHRAAEKTAAAEGLLRPPETRLAIVVDQMEELFSLERFDDKQRKGFVKALAALTRKASVWIIGTMRSDFYPHCAELPELAALKEGGGEYQLLPPTSPEIQQMIGYPARAAGMLFEEKQNGERLDHVLQEAATRDPKALPLLEFTLAELYKLRDKRLLTFAAYEQLGGMEGALGRRAEGVFSALPAAVQAVLPAVCRALATIRLGEEEAVVTKPALRGTLEAVPQQKALLNAFIDARLLVSDQTGTGDAVVRFAHEALLRRWPRLAQWLTEDLDFLRIRARVESEWRRWSNEGKLPELLLQPGKPLAEAQHLLSRRAELAPEIIRYVELSQASAQRARRRRRILVTALVASLLVGTLVSTVFGIQNRYNAQRADDNAQTAKKKQTEAERQTEIARKSEREAQDARNQERVQRKVAVDAADGERKAAAKARKAEIKALEAAAAEAKANNEAQTNARKLADNLYIATTSLARKEWLGNNVRRTEQVLGACDPERRGWEWYYLSHLCHSEVRSLSNIWPITSLACRKDGRIIVAGNSLGDIRPWFELRPGRYLAIPGRLSFRRKAGDGFLEEGFDEFAVASVVISPDGKWIAAASQVQAGKRMFGGLFGQVKVWDAISRKEIWTFPDEAHSLAVSPDGKLLALGMHNGVRVIDMTTQKESFRIEASKSLVLSLAFSPDGKRLATGGMDGWLRVWEVETQKEMFAVATPDMVRPLAFHPQGQLVGCGNQGAIDIYKVDAKRGKDEEIRPWLTLRGHKGVIRSLAFHPQSLYVASGSNDTTVKLWDLRQGIDVNTIRGHSEAVTGVLFSADGKQLLSSSMDGSVKFWNAFEHQEAFSREGIYAAVSPDGKTVATTALSRPRPFVEGAKSVWLWDARSGDLVREVKDLSRDIGCVAFSADGKLAAAGGEGEIKIWNVATGRVVQTLRGSESIRRIAFRADGRVLASAAKGRFALGSKVRTPSEVKLWDLKTGTVLFTVSEFDDYDSASLAFSPEGKILAVADPLGVRLFDGRTGDFIRGLPGVSAAFSADGKSLLTTGGDKLKAGWVKVWQTDGWELLYQLKGHSDTATAAAMSPDGKRVASAGKDGMVRIWDTASKTEILPLQHSGRVTNVLFDPHGRFLVSTSGDFLSQGYTRIWVADAPEKKQVPAAGK